MRLSISHILVWLFVFVQLNIQAQIPQHIKVGEENQVPVWESPLYIALAVALIGIAIAVIWYRGKSKH